MLRSFIATVKNTLINWTQLVLHQSTDYIHTNAGCTKTYNKLKLLQNHLRDHTGNAGGKFLEILLKDQAKALNTPAKQMRWHPLVIQWCIKMYCKSHSMYHDMRLSGGLKLPSGRTLSDYKNFNAPKSG